MALSDAATIALARDLYPDVTVAVASDAFLAAWLPWARSLVGVGPWRTRYDLGVAILLAHVAYRELSALGGGSSSPAGPVTAISTLGMSASFGSTAGGSTSPLDAELSTTRPGSRFLALQATLPNANILGPVNP